MTKCVLSSSSDSCSYNESQLRRVNIQRNTACWSWSKSMNWSINYGNIHALEVRVPQIETVTNVINWSQSTRKGCIFRVWWKHLDGTLHTILEMRSINYRIRMLWKHVYDKSIRWLMQLVPEHSKRLYLTSFMATSRLYVARNIRNGQISNRLYVGL